MDPKFKNIDRKSWHLFMDESGTKGYKRLRKLKNQNQWNNFWPDPDPQNANFFSLIGLLIHGHTLIDDFIPAVKKVKFELYQNENIVLHLSDMLSAKGSFEKYKNKPDLFQSDLKKIIKYIESIPFYMFIVHIDKVEMLNKYSEPAEPYEYAPTTIMERIAGFLKYNLHNYLSEISTSVIRVWFEARSKKEDIELKRYMVDELKLTEKELRNKTKFPRYPKTVKNVRSIEWHIHGLPKKPEDFIRRGYYKSKYSYEVGSSLIHGLHIADLMVSARRRYKENDKYQRIKYLEVEPLNHFIEESGKLVHEILRPS